MLFTSFNNPNLFNIIVIFFKSQSSRLQFKHLKCDFFSQSFINTTLNQSFCFHFSFLIYRILFLQSLVMFHNFTSSFMLIKRSFLFPIFCIQKLYWQHIHSSNPDKIIFQRLSAYPSNFPYIFSNSCSCMMTSVP